MVSKRVSKEKAYDPGRRIAEALMKVAEGRGKGYSIKDLEKLKGVARRLGIDPAEKSRLELARKVATEALADYSRVAKEPLKFTASTITKRRLNLLEENGVIPNNIEVARENIKHRTSLGCEASPISLLFAGISRAIADYDGMQVSTDLTDILFGTPHLVNAFLDLGTLKAEAVNIAIHGHNPVLSKAIVDAARSLAEEARGAGASGINIVGICCKGNEALLPKGVPMAADFASQELVLATGTVDLLVTDHQCVRPSLSEVCSCQHTVMATTMANVDIPYETQARFQEEDAEESAQAMVRLAIEAFKRRDPSKGRSPEVRHEVIVGFSLEQIEDLFAKIVPEDPMMHLIDSIKDGKIRGIALMAGCNNQRAEQDYNHLAIAQELLRNDVLLLSTGCSASVLAKNGFLSADATDLYAGTGLRSFLAELSERNGVKLPPIWHMGSCADNARAMSLATSLANHFQRDVDSIPFVVCVPEAHDEKVMSIGTWCVALGLTVHVGSVDHISQSSLVSEVLTRTARDVFGGFFIFEPNPEIAAKRLLDEVERRRWKLKLANYITVEKGEPIDKHRLIRMAIDGGIIATGYADQLLSVAIERHGQEQKVEFPETGYALPAILAWEGEEVHTLADMRSVLGQVRKTMSEETTLESALAAGEAAMVSAEIIEALKYIRTERPYEGTSYCGFVPDRVLRELGIAFVDDTIPGCAVLIGMAEDPKRLAKIVRDCQGKGMLIIASFDIIRQLQDEGIKTGLEVRLYPVGEFTQVVHGLNFAIRAALTFGNVQSGDRERLQKYLQKRPKVFALLFGPIDAIKASVGFALLLNGAPIITDQAIEVIPEKLIAQPEYEKMVQTAIELRGIQVKLAPVSLPVAYGPAFEGETVRRPDTYIEAGGAAKTAAFELLRMRGEAEVEDSKITFIGKDVDELPEGSKTSLAIVVDVYGRKMQEDFESVLERRIHQFINFAEGAWHTGQRNTIWIRLSKNSVRAGLQLKHFGDILVTKIKGEFGNIVSRVQVTIITDEGKVKELLPKALARYRNRDQHMAGLSDESVSEFYTCSLCQSFAPDHICIVTPERLGLCGAINWLDAKASQEIAPTGPNQPIEKGEVIDARKGQWKGVNQAVHELTHHKLERFNVYTIMEDPMTSCGCFEVIVAMNADAQAVILVNREYAGMTPVGLRFSTLAGSIGGGKQTPGFMGVGRKYILSKKFISADGGFLRIAWMPKDLKVQMMEGLKRRAEELGEPDFVDKIADESITDNAEGLREWMVKVGHPVLRMPPLLQ